MCIHRVYRTGHTHDISHTSHTYIQDGSNNKSIDNRQYDIDNKLMIIRDRKPLPSIKETVECSSEYKISYNSTDHIQSYRNMVDHQSIPNNQI